MSSTSETAETALEVTCVLLTWNSELHVERCISSVVHDLNTTGLSHELIVIDNGSIDGTLDLLRSCSGDLTIVPLGRNTGTTFPRNIGLRMSRGRILLILDSDIEIVEERTFSRLIEILDDDPAAGIVSPRLIYASGNYQKSTDRFPTLISKLGRYFWLRRIEKKESADAADNAKGIAAVDYAISAVWAFRRELIDCVGLLDENIFYAPEDVDYCLRVWLSGHSVLHDSRVTVIHHAQELGRRGLFSPSTRSHIAGLFYYFKKFRYLFSTRGIYERIDSRPDIVGSK